MWRNESQNGICGISSRALSGRRSFVAKLTQGIAQARSALGCILAAFQAAFGASYSRRRFFSPPSSFGRVCLAFQATLRLRQ
jgi:hypothetical protein